MLHLNAIQRLFLAAAKPRSSGRIDLVILRLSRLFFMMDDDFIFGFFGWMGAEELFRYHTLLYTHIYLFSFLFFHLVLLLGDRPVILSFTIEDTSSGSFLVLSDYSSLMECNGWS